MLLRWTTVAVFALLPALLLAAEPDADGDGLDDAQEDILGTDPRSPERLQAVLDDEPQSAAARTREGYDGSKDFSRVEFCHVGGDRYLWRVTFAEPPRLADSVLHVIDRWRHLGTATDEEGICALLDRAGDAGFDPDAYRIIARCLERVAPRDIVMMGGQRR